MGFRFSPGTCCGCAPAGDCTIWYASNALAGGDGITTPFGGPVELGATFEGGEWSSPVMDPGQFDPEWWTQTVGGSAVADTEPDGGKIIIEGPGETLVVNSQETSKTSFRAYADFSPEDIHDGDVLTLAFNFVDEDNYYAFRFEATTDFPAIALWQREAGVETKLWRIENDLSMASGGPGWDADAAGPVRLNVSFCKGIPLCQLDGVPDVDYSGDHLDLDDIAGRKRYWEISIGHPGLAGGLASPVTLTSGFLAVGGTPIGDPIKVDYFESRNTNVNAPLDNPGCKPNVTCEGMLFMRPATVTVRQQGVTHVGDIHWQDCGTEDPPTVITFGPDIFSDFDPGGNYFNHIEYPAAEDDMNVTKESPWAPLIEDNRFCLYKLDEPEVDEVIVDTETCDGTTVVPGPATPEPVQRVSQVEFVPNTVRANIGTTYVGFWQKEKALPDFYRPESIFGELTIPTTVAPDPTFADVSNARIFIDEIGYDPSD